MYGRKVINILAGGPSAGYQGVTVYLDGTDGAGNPVQLDTVTDADGYLEFTDLWPGGASQVPESAIESTPKYHQG